MCCPNVLTAPWTLLLLIAQSTSLVPRWRQGRQRYQAMAPAGYIHTPLRLKALKRHGSPEPITTNGLRPYRRDE